MDYNHIGIIGRLTRSLEVKYTNNGKAVINTTIACGEINDGVSFFDVDIWGKSAENCGKYLDKGDQVFVSGRLKQNIWTTAEGEKKSKVKIVAHYVQFLKKKNKQPINNADESNGTEPIEQIEKNDIHNNQISDEDIPF